MVKNLQFKEIETPEPEESFAALDEILDFLAGGEKRANVIA
jgi:hypothetical protein